jgi:hypothetical protein
MLGGARLAAIFSETGGTHFDRGAALSLYAPSAPSSPSAPSIRLHPSPFRVLQRQLQLLRKAFDGRPLPLPGAVGFEAKRADPAAPWRNHPANGAIVRAIGVLLIDPLNDIGSNPNERAQRRR